MPDDATQIDPGLETAIVSALARSVAAGTWQLRHLAAKRQDASRRRHLLRADHVESTRALAIKVHSQPRVTAREVAAMTQLSELTPDSLAPVYVDPENRFYALPWCEAPSLWPRIEAGDRAGALRLAGAWLARLHAAGPAVPSFKRSYANLGLPDPAQDLDLGHAVAALARRKAGVNLRAGPMVWLHNDVGPDNFFDLGDRLIGYDRENQLTQLALDGLRRSPPADGGDA